MKTKKDLIALIIFLSWTTTALLVAFLIDAKYCVYVHLIGALIFYLILISKLRSKHLISWLNTNIKSKDKH